MIFTWLLYALVTVGLAFQVLGTLALHRFPDVYTRLHGSTKCTTFGSMFIYAGIIIYGLWMYVSGNPEYVQLSMHTLLIMLLVLITNPTGAHALARGAYRSGVMPERAVVDRLREDGK